MNKYTWVIHIVIMVSVVFLVASAITQFKDPLGALYGTAACFALIFGTAWLMKYLLKKSQKGVD